MPQPWGVLKWVENLAWDLLTVGVLTVLLSWGMEQLTPLHLPWPVVVAASVVGAIVDTVKRWRRRERAVG